MKTALKWLCCATLIVVSPGIVYSILLWATWFSGFVMRWTVSTIDGLNWLLPS